LNLRGRLHVSRREGPQAKSAFQEAITLFREIRNPLALGEACYFFGQGQKELGEEREGKEYLLLSTLPTRTRASAGTIQCRRREG
jgi:hypothetical protein